MVDSRTRRGLLAVQFDQVIRDPEVRTVTLETPVAQFRLTRYENVITCCCRLTRSTEAGEDALRRRGAVDGTFIISHKLAPRDFGVWLDQLLTDDLGLLPDAEVAPLEVATV